MKGSRVRPLGKPRVAIKVERIGKSNKYEVVPGSTCVLDAATLVKENKDADIIDDNGEEVTASGRFLWTAETIDPFHLVVDMF